MTYICGVLNLSDAQRRSFGMWKVGGEREAVVRARIKVQKYHTIDVVYLNSVAIVRD